MEKHAILGGGNIGSLMAADLSCAGIDVWVYTSDADSWSQDLEVLNPDSSTLRVASPIQATADLEEAVANADYIWITYPTYLLEKTASKLHPLVVAGQKIGMVPGACAEFFFEPLIKKGCILFGFQRVHSVARIGERGKSVYELGRKPKIDIAAIPSIEAAPIASHIETLFNTPCFELPNYLALTLVPSNPILHTARIASMFADWSEGVDYPRNILFYEEWTDKDSDLMLKCDDELQSVCEAIPVDLSSVVPLRIHYESSTAELMTKKISSIPAFKGLKSPMKAQSDNRWVPEFSSRYFRADFAFGLEAIRQIARLTSVPTPSIDSVLSWYYRIAQTSAEFSIKKNNLEELLELYR